MIDDKLVTKYDVDDVGAHGEKSPIRKTHLNVRYADGAESYDLIPELVVQPEYMEECESYGVQLDANTRLVITTYDNKNIHIHKETVI